MDLPKRIYFDTSILIKANWPHLSAQFTSCNRIAKVLKIKTILPEPVELELEAKWLRDLRKKREDLLAVVKGIDKHLYLNRSEAQIDLIDDTTARKAYLELTKAVKAVHGLETISYLRDNVAELLEMSLSRRPPFSRDKDVGFQDAIILLSVLHDLEVTGESGALVSADKAFQNAEVQKLATAKGARLALFNSLKAISEALLQGLEQRARQYYDEKAQQALSALNAIRDDLEAFVAQKLEVPESSVEPVQYGIFGRLVGVESIRLENIVTAVPADPLKKKPGEGDNISADAQVLIMVVLEGTSIGNILPPRSFKVGEKAPSMLARAMEGETIGHVRKAYPLHKEVQIEASATVTEDGYKDIKFTSVTPK